MSKMLPESFHPLYFLAALGLGGLAVSFYMYPLHTLPHVGSPVAVFEHIWPVVFSGTLQGILMGLSMMVFYVLAIAHLVLLAWNLLRFKRFRQTESYQTMRHSNDEVTLMAVPLTLAMTVNVLLLMGATAVPGLWAYKEWLFPLALLAFGGIGFYALNLLGEYLQRLIIHGDFDFAKNNNLSQMLAIFALTMVAVGFAAAAAMSSTQATVLIGLFASIFFLTLALPLVVIKAVWGFQGMFSNGLNQDSAPSLWLLIPILTLMTLTFLRDYHGLHHLYGLPWVPGLVVVILLVVVAMQLQVGFFGHAILQKMHYYQNYLHGDTKHVGSFSLICPGVASMVLGMFAITLIFVQTGMVAQASWIHWLLIAPLAWLQWKTLLTMIHLLRRLLGRD